MTKKVFFSPVIFLALAVMIGGAMLAKAETYQTVYTNGLVIPGFTAGCVQVPGGPPCGSHSTQQNTAVKPVPKPTPAPTSITVAEEEFVQTQESCTGYQQLCNEASKTACQKSDGSVDYTCVNDCVKDYNQQCKGITGNLPTVTAPIQKQTTTTKTVQPKTKTIPPEQKEIDKKELCVNSGSICVENCKQMENAKTETKCLDNCLKDADKYCGWSAVKTKQSDEPLYDADGQRTMASLLDGVLTAHFEQIAEEIDAKKNPTPAYLIKERRKQLNADIEEAMANLNRDLDALYIANPGEETEQVHSALDADHLAYKRKLLDAWKADPRDRDINYILGNEFFRNPQSPNDFLVARQAHMTAFVGLGEDEQMRKTLQSRVKEERNRNGFDKAFNSPKPETSSFMGALSAELDENWSNVKGTAKSWVKQSDAYSRTEAYSEEVRESFKGFKSLFGIDDSKLNLTTYEQ
ncbi:MAG: hypothetical protein NT098_05450 [Candidatus Parcubacteria bacterium]|nr:hypothetical protein [Candidatus Parcubacteria bacterium]